MQRHIYISFLIIAAFVLLVLTLPGCAPGNPHQTEGFLLPVALQRACVSGKVTDAVTGRGVHGVKLLVVPPIAGPEIKTNRDGFFYAEFPGGSYRLSFVKGGYRDAEQTVLLKPGETAGRDVSLDPVAPVIVDAGKTVTGAAPGSTVTVKAKVTVRDGSPPEEIRWQWKADQEEGGVTANVAKDDGPAVRVRLPGIEEYKRALFYRLGKDG
ncbi:MAG TPA: carboxypeptidase-like regulatory domain-containing protein, partial [Geobacteraceae bacterium]|nr:carboxypeptidase-like regulatory domain-containing protein [Geobacteraceae bacterium]